MNFGMERSATQSYMTYRLAPGEVLEEMGVGMLTNNTISGLLSVNTVMEDGVETLRYRVTSLTALSGYWGGVVNRKKMLTFIMGFCRAIMECQEYMLDPSRLVLDMEHIFVNSITGEVYLAYLPVAGAEAQLTVTPREFLLGLIESRNISLDPNENGSYYAILRNELYGQTFSVEVLYQRLQEMEKSPQPAAAPAAAENKPNAVETPAPASQPAAGWAVHTPQPPVVKAPEPAPTPAEPAERKRFGLLSSKPKKAETPKQEKKAKQDKKNSKSAKKPDDLFGMVIPGSIQAPSDAQNSVPPAPAAETPVWQSTPAPAAPARDAAPAWNAGGGNGWKTPDTSAQDVTVPGGVGKTVSLSGAQESQTRYLGANQGTGGALILHHKRTGQRAVLNHFPFHVGRSAQAADMHIDSPGGYLGSDHAYFLNDAGTGITIVDNNSKNQTWMNDQKLIPGQHYPVKPGDKIVMADEEFEILQG